VCIQRPPGCPTSRCRFGVGGERERQIYQLLAKGNANKDIANRLELSLYTVETHCWRFTEKLV